METDEGDTEAAEDSWTGPWKLLLTKDRWTIFVSTSVGAKEVGATCRASTCFSLLYLPPPCDIKGAEQTEKRPSPRDRNDLQHNTQAIQAKVDVGFYTPAA